MFFALQLDRGNISQALSDNMLQDLGMDTNNYNHGQAIFYVAFLFAEVPSQLISKKLGPDVWIPVQMVSWSIVASFQSFLTGKTSFYICRGLLGLIEGRSFRPLFSSRQKLTVLQVALFRIVYCTSATGTIPRSFLLDLVSFGLPFSLPMSSRHFLHLVFYGYVAFTALPDGDGFSQLRELSLVQSVFSHISTCRHRRLRPPPNSAGKRGGLMCTKRRFWSIAFFEMTHPKAKCITAKVSDFGLSGNASPTTTCGLYIY